ncbi:MAG: hypothetical protein IH605_21440 [Burkholderiales bacterium]|nr:hypothetical protein [Burkholderiales bacterium]
MNAGTMDFAYLRSEGIRHLEEMNGQVWTDFNTHEPGITILDQSRYAIADLGNRERCAMPDRLAGTGCGSYARLYTPAMILPNAAVNLADLSKMAIRVPGEKNA